MSLGRTSRQLALLAAFGATLLVLVVERAAALHDTLTRSTPAANARLDEVPTELRLTFSNAVALDLARITLLGPDSVPVTLGVFSLHADSARVVIAPIVGRMLTGRHVVQWQIAGADGHPVRGSFAFTVTADATLATPILEPALDTAPVDSMPGEHADHDVAADAAFDAESPLYAAIRWLGLVGILGVIGAVGFRGLVMRGMNGAGAPSPSAASLASSAARVGLLATIVAAIATILRLGAQAVALQPGGAFDAGIIGTVVSGTTWGTAWLIEAAAVIIALAGFVVARRAPWGWSLAAIGALGLAVALAMTGHSVAAERQSLAAPIVEVLHVLAAGGWLGTLLVLVAAGLPWILSRPTEERGSTATAMMAAFSPAALVFAGLAVATGVFATWVHAGVPPSLSTPYGRTLAIKVAVFLVVAAVGAYNWRRVRPKLGDAVVVGHLRRSATLELVGAAAVLAVTAVLVGVPVQR